MFYYSRARHPNVVTFFGIVRFPDNELGIVSEYVMGGSLDKFLKDRKSELDIAKLLRFASTAAAGIAFLSERQIIHQDLAARNILV